MYKPSSFIEHGVVLTDNPMLSEEYDYYFEQLLELEPWICPSTEIYWSNVIIKIWRSIHKNQTPSKIQKHIGYRVTLLVEEGKDKTFLSSIYVFKNPLVLRELLQFLANQEVVNLEDIQLARNFLMETLFSLEKK